MHFYCVPVDGFDPGRLKLSIFFSDNLEVELLRNYSYHTCVKNNGNLFGIFDCNANQIISRRESRFRS
jgi:hypothetical protein